MKKYRRICVAVLLLFALIAAAANLYLRFGFDEDSGRPWRVEIGRLCRSIESEGFEELDLSSCEYVVAVYADDGSESFTESNSECALRKVNGVLYRFEYSLLADDKAQQYKVLNVSLAAAAAVTLLLLAYVGRKILRPFEKLSDVPYELSRGNLTVPVKENKNRFFGRFLWGIDLLRENLEQQRSRELELQKEKKTVLLSLSHDIKTPLSAIKLYSSALSKGLYADADKQREIAAAIGGKADEIENYVSQIISASNEDFLSLEVNRGEFYLSKPVEELRAYYTDKLSLVKTAFEIAPYTDCLLRGDSDRALEVLQNIMENAIKYGDGGYIKLSFDHEDDCRLVSVTNSGCTLAQAELNHIFESFWRGSNASDKSGSGLGLYICRQLMQKMEGDIFARTEKGCMTVTAVFSKA